MCCGPDAAFGEAVRAKDASKDHLIVYYFYGNIRCGSCKKIEQYTKDTLDKYFSQQIDNKSIIFKTVNMEKKKNGHYVKKYQLYTRAVVLSMIRNGKESEYKDLKKVWQLLGNREKFENYEKEEISTYLKNLEGQ
ncbi:nitrophenyl compound nitroreductase subunit ArsF family protein [Candidatus Auribacterota bacterium]